MHDCVRFHKDSNSIFNKRKCQVPCRVFSFFIYHPLGNKMSFLRKSNKKKQLGHTKIFIRLSKKDLQQKFVKKEFFKIKKKTKQEKNTLLAKKKFRINQKILSKKPLLLKLFFNSFVVCLEKPTKNQNQKIPLQCSILSKIKFTGFFFLIKFKSKKSQKTTSKKNC